ncbi:MAG: YlxR family protein [Actinomycetota bacterium]|nr:YlxR family protein [Actinomycetota bacterium]
MCVGCRERAAAAELLRVVAEPAGSGFRAVPDPARRLPGRGASLHPDSRCLALAQRRGGLVHALRVAGPLDVAELREHLAQR